MGGEMPTKMDAETTGLSLRQWQCHGGSETLGPSRVTDPSLYGNAEHDLKTDGKTVFNQVFQKTI